MCKCGFCESEDKIGKQCVPVSSKWDSPYFFKKLVCTAISSSVIYRHFLSGAKLLHIDTNCSRRDVKFYAQEIVLIVNFQLGITPVLPLTLRAKNTPPKVSPACFWMLLVLQSIIFRIDLLLTLPDYARVEKSKQQNS